MARYYVMRDWWGTASPYRSIRVFAGPFRWRWQARKVARQRTRDNQFPTVTYSVRRSV